jgi:hypothetical protein
MAASEPKTKRDERAERLAEALRANLRRRKDQARGRRDGDEPADGEPGGDRPPPAPPSRHKTLRS